MIGLQPNRQSARQADRVSEPRHYAALAGHQDEILVSHQLAHGRDHFRRQAAGKRAEHFARRLIAEQPIAKLSHRHPGDRFKSRAVMRIHDEPRHFIDFIRNQRLFHEAARAANRPATLRRHALFVIRSRDPGESIPAARGRRLGQQRRQAIEAVRLFSNSRTKLRHKSRASARIRRFSLQFIIGCAVRASLNHENTKVRKREIASMRLSVFDLSYIRAFAIHSFWLRVQARSASSAPLRETICDVL